MAHVQGMTPEGIRKAVDEAAAFIKSQNVEDFNTLAQDLSQRIATQGVDIVESISNMFANIPRIAYAEDGENVSGSDTDGYIKIVRTVSGNRTTKVEIHALDKWVGSLIVEADHGRSTGTDQSFSNWTPIGKKFDVVAGTRIFTIDRKTTSDHIGAVKVTFFVKPGALVLKNVAGGSLTLPTKSTWHVLSSWDAPETSYYNAFLNVTWAAATNGDDYGVRVRVGSNIVAVVQKSGVGPVFPWESGIRSMSIDKSQFKVPAGTTIYLEAYSAAGEESQRSISEWNGQMSYITSDRG